LPTIDIIVKVIDKASAQLRALSIRTAEAAKTMERQTATLTRTFDAFGSTLIRVGWQVRWIGWALRGAGMSALWFSATLVGAMYPIVDIFGKTQYAIAGATAALRVTGRTTVDVAEQVARARDDIILLGLQLGYMASDATKAFETIIKMGYDVDDALLVLRATMELARATGLELNTVNEALVETMKAFGLEAESADKAASILLATSYRTTASVFELNSAIGFAASLARRFDMSLSDTAAALAVLTAKGVSATVAGRRLAAFLNNLIENSDRLGFSIYDASGELLPFHDIIRALRYHLDEMSSSEERAAYLSAIFGVQGMHVAQALVSVDESGRLVIDTLEETASAMERNTTFARETASVLMETLPAAIDRAKAAFSKLAVAIGEEVAPHLSKLLDKLTELVEKEDVITRIREFADAFTEQLFKAIQDTLSVLISLISKFTDFVLKLGEVGAKSDETGSKIRSLGAALGRLSGTLVAVGPFLFAFGTALAFIGPFIYGTGLTLRYVASGLRALPALFAALTAALGISAGALGTFSGAAAAAAGSTAGLRSAAVLSATKFPLLTTAVATAGAKFGAFIAVLTGTTAGLAALSATGVIAAALLLALGAAAAAGVPPTQALGNAWRWLCDRFKAFADTVAPILLDLWKNYLEPFLRAIGELIYEFAAPPIRWFWRTVLKPWLEGWRAALTDLWHKVIVPFAEFLATVWDGAMKHIKEFYFDVVKPILDGLKGLFTMVYNALKWLAKMWKALWGESPGMAADLKAFWEVAKPIFDAIKGILNSIITVIKLLSGTFETAVDKISDSLWWLEICFNSLHDTFKSAIDGIKDLFESLIAVFRNVWNAIRPILDAFTGAVNALIGAISYMITLARQVPGAAAAVSEGVQDAVASAREGMEDVAETVVSGVQTVVSHVQRGMQQLAGIVVRPEEEAGERQLGGLITRRGLYYLHPGERVIPAGRTTTVVINVTGFISRDVVRDLARLLAEQYRLIELT